MKRRLASLVATGVMAIGAFAGTAGAADAATASTVYGGHTCWQGIGCFDWQGPYAISQNCVTFVASIHELGVWDCEYYNPWKFAPTGSGWYATSRVII